MTMTTGRVRERSFSAARVVFAATLVLSAAACEERAKPNAASAPSAAARADDVYTVRGVVKELPEAGKPATQLKIHHEEIPTFIGFDGKPVGMKEMTMPFPLAPGVSLEGHAVGDTVEFVFEVFRAGKRYHLTKITKLPAETELKLKAPK
jgi:Cu/Ag efflux protein CusF